MKKVSKKKKIPRKPKTSVVKHQRMTYRKKSAILETFLLVIFAGIIVLYLALYMRG